MASTVTRNEQDRTGSVRSGSENSGSLATGRSSGEKRSYLGDSIAELKKVTFPTGAETRQATLVTIFIVLFVSLCLFLLDQVFFHLMNAILG